MGGRVEGKTKKKSVKANVTSKFGSKRKASRMGKKVKKGQSGPSTEFITRSTALKKLQITLKDFRRLCILKGVYPRVPEKAPKGSDKVYYDIKDISFIMHEPLLEKFREFKTFMKKIRKASGRNQVTEARRINGYKPNLSLNHLVKERYPRFIDALRDLDDALCMVHLFASLPSTGRITASHTLTCCELSRYWQFYVAKSKSLQRVFVSIKGVYFQAEIMGEPINWLVPHKFTQTLPKEVDIRVMLTFLEFYEVFLKFVLFKLYVSQGMQYPPLVDNRLDEAGCCLLAVRTLPLLDGGDEKSLKVQESKPVAPVHHEVTANSKEALASLPKLLETLTASNLEELDGEEDELGVLPGPLEAAFSGDQGSNIFGTDQTEEMEENERAKTFLLTSEGENRGRLFAGLYFFVNREVPLDWFQLCIVAFGGQVGWEGELSPYAAADERITHHVVDRPMQGLQCKTREYVQPQWVLDSINANILLPVQNYLPGAKLPPHLSPFVDDDKEGYLPRYREELRRLGAAEGRQKTATTKAATPAAVPDGTKEDEEEEEEEVEEEMGAEDDEEEGEDLLEEEEEEEEPKVTTKKDRKQNAAKKSVDKKTAKQIEEEEALELSKMMMSKKTKRLYGRMQHGIEAKKSGVSVLEEKRKALEAPVVEKSGQKIKKTKK